MKLKSLFAFFLFCCTLSSLSQEKVSVEDAIKLALEKNYDVRVARQLSEAASTDNRYAPAAFLPQVNALGSSTWNQSEQELQTRSAQTGELVTREGPVASNTLNASVQAVWTLFDGARMFATRARVAQLAEQGELNVKNQMINTIAEVITNYFNIVRQKQQLRAIEEQMAVGEERVKLAQRKLEVGTGVKPELLQAQVDLNTQRAQAIQQQTLIEQSKQQLNALVGLQLPATFDVTDSIAIDLDVTETEQFDNVENTNFQLQAARKNLDIASYSLREQRAGFLPSINLNAAYTYNKTENTKLLNPFGLLFLESLGPNYGISVNLPIFNAFNARRLTQQAKIELMRQNILFDQQRAVVNVALRNAIVNYDNAKKILAIEEETITAAKENVNIALETFKRGVTTSVELRIAQQSLADAYNRLIAARYNAKIAETDLLRLNGSLLK
jgi:outer membrane protein